jgi:CheY-like chemotaxis protein
MKKFKILLVEDDELDVISVQRSLTRVGVDYELQTAYNGKEAISLLTDKQSTNLPDVILLDLNMPKMNGIEFLAALRSVPDLKHIKVFVMTTSADTADRAATEELEIAGYIIKPLSYNDNSKRADSMDAFVQFHLRKILSGDAE